ncbi:unnamed protein product, partial [Ixodes pacificus]
MAGDLLKCIILCTSFAACVVCSVLTNEMTYRPVPTHRRPVFFPSWSKAARDVAHFLGQPLHDTTDFIGQLATRRTVLDILDLMYRLHPRLRFFLIFQLLVLCTLLAACLPVTCVACRTRGKLPFLENLMRPHHCVVCCVSIGVLVALVLANLVVMLGCHAGMSDATRRLPAAYQIALGDLRLYFNQTVQELYAELEEGDTDISQSVQRFLYKVLPREALQRTKAIICKGTKDLFTLKLKDCTHSMENQVATKILTQSTSGLFWEHLQHQLKHALDSVERLEASVDSFEAQTGLWTTTRVLGLVAVPMVMVLLCLVVTFTGFGIGLSIHNRVLQYAGTWISSRYTGILMLTNTALVIMFFVFSTPLLMTMTTVGILGESYVCQPYRTEAYEHLHKLIGVVWPYAQRGELFSRLTPEHILAKCAGDGVSIANLEMDGEHGIETDKRNDKWTLIQGTYTIPQANLRSATAGNCRPVHDVIRSSMNLFCNLYMNNHLGMTLSLGIEMLLLLLVLPGLLVVSQYFLQEDTCEDDDYQASSNMFREENSEEDLVSNRNTPNHPEKNNSKWSCCNSASSSLPLFLSDLWRRRLEEVYRIEGTDICSEVRDKRYTLSSICRSGSSSKLGLKKIFKRTQKKPLLSESGWSRVNIDPRTPPQRFVNSVLVDEVFPRQPAIPRQKKNKFRLNIKRKPTCKNPLATIDEESESPESSYVSALSSVSE